MKTFLVNIPSGTTTVTADRSFNHDGRLVFIKNVSGQRFGEVVAGFAPGHWLYFKQIGETNDDGRQDQEGLAEGTAER